MRIEPTPEALRASPSRGHADGPAEPDPWHPDSKPTPGMNETKTLLRLTQLRKAFDAVVATNGVDLDVRAGEIHAIIGPNGAGKSTLIAQICGEIRPDLGRHRTGRAAT